MTRLRNDNGGDRWANAHRHNLSDNWYLMDMDGYFGLLAFAANTGNRLFMEYVPDDWKNRESATREFGWVAIFDRKRNEQAMRSSGAKLSKDMYLCLCRRLGRCQPVMPRFFYILGTGEHGPWPLVEYDVWTAKEIGHIATLQNDEFSKGAWDRIWNSIGLEQARKKIEAWLLCPPKADDDIPF